MRFVCSLVSHSDGWCACQSHFSTLIRILVSPTQCTNMAEAKGKTKSEWLETEVVISLCAISFPPRQLIALCQENKLIRATFFRRDTQNIGKPISDTAVICWRKLEAAENSRLSLSFGQQSVVFTLFYGKRHRECTNSAHFLLQKTTTSGNVPPPPPRVGLVVGLAVGLQKWQPWDPVGQDPWVWTRNFWPRCTCSEYDNLKCRETELLAQPRSQCASTPAVLFS